MNHPKVAAYFASICLLLSCAGCNDPTPDELITEEKKNEFSKADRDSVRAATMAVERNNEWKEHRDQNGRLVRLFQAPPPEPDERHDFTAKTEGHPLAVSILRYGSLWRASVAVFDGETETVVLEGSSLEGCLAQVRERYELEEPLKRVLME